MKIDRTIVWPGASGKTLWCNERPPEREARKFREIRVNCWLLAPVRVGVYECAERGVRLRQVRVPPTPLRVDEFLRRLSSTPNTSRRIRRRGIQSEIHVSLSLSAPFRLGPKGDEREVKIEKLGPEVVD